VRFRVNAGDKLRGSVEVRTNAGKSRRGRECADKGRARREDGAEEVGVKEGRIGDDDLKGKVWTDAEVV